MPVRAAHAGSICVATAMEALLVSLLGAGLLELTLPLLLVSLG